MKRRDFLKGASVVTGLHTGIPLASATAPQGAGDRSGETFDRDRWATIAAVQDHLLPAEPGAPGSRDVNATAYLDHTLADPDFDQDIKDFVLQGIGWLNEIAEGSASRPFHLVDPAEREDLLQQIADRGAGERWLSTLISYTLEALLADPLYGGNPDGIGWKWLGHDSGRPRPTPDKIYGRLGKS